MVNSISGINLKIGADLSELKKELGTVGDTVEKDLKPAQEPVATLKENFASIAKKAGQIAAIAISMGKIGKALTGFTKGILEDALAVNPETKQKVDAVKDAFNQMKTALGESLLPLIEEFAPKLESALTKITDWIKKNPESAQNMMLVATALGGLSSAAAVAGPALMLLNIGLAPISGTALAVATAIGGLVLIIGMLIDKSDELTKHTTATSEDIENMDTASQQLVQNGFGELEIWDKNTMEDENGNLVYWDENAWNAENNGFGAWVSLQGEAAAAVSQTTEAVNDQATAMDAVAESTETTKSTAEQVGEILSTMQEAVDGVTTSLTEDNGLNQAMADMNDVLASEAFQQFASSPISEEVAESWSTFGTAVSAATDGFTTIKAMGEEEGGLQLPIVPEETMTSWQNFASIFTGNEDEGTVGLLTTLDTVSQKITGILTALQTLAAYMTNDFIAAITTLQEALCIVNTDEQGNAGPSGGNTLYNSLSNVSTVIGDIEENTRKVIEIWEGQLLTACDEVKKYTGKVEGALKSVSAEAQNAADAFNDAAGAVDAFREALIKLHEYQNGQNVEPSSGGTTFGGMHADGGPVTGGVTYLVGERGPELFTPNRSGYIVPNEALTASTSGQPININIEGSIYGESYLESYVTGKLAKTVRRELILAS